MGKQAKVEGPLDGVVLVPVPRAVLAAAAPEWVSETTCESVFGLDTGRFVRACKAGKIEDARRDGQLWLAPVASVRSFLRGLPAAPRKARKARPEGSSENDFDAMPLPPGVRRVG